MIRLDMPAAIEIMETVQLTSAELKTIGTNAAAYEASQQATEETKYTTEQTRKGEDTLKQKRIGDIAELAYAKWSGGHQAKLKTYGADVILPSGLRASVKATDKLMNPVDSSVRMNPLGYYEDCGEDGCYSWLSAENLRKSKSLYDIMVLVYVPPHQPDQPQIRYVVRYDQLHWIAGKPIKPSKQPDKARGYSGYRAIYEPEVAALADPDSVIHEYIAERSMWLARIIANRIVAKFKK